MKRVLTKELALWANSGHRRPLLIRGGRQIGKSYIVQEFGRLNYDKLVEEMVGYTDRGIAMEHDAELYNPS